MADITGLCNKALANLRKSPIEDVEHDQTPEAKVCRRHAYDTRDEALENHDWQFASRTVALMLHPDDPPAGWTVRYNYPPEDCLVPRRLLTAGMMRNAEPLPFRVELSEDGNSKTIVADHAEAQLQYTAIVTDVNKWSPMFQTAFVWLLTSNMTMALTGKDDLKDVAMQKYLMALSSARAINLNSQYGGPAQKPGAIRARG